MYGASSSIVVLMLTPLALRVISRIRRLNRSIDFGAIIRLIFGPAEKLMPTERLSMRRIREVLRLRHQGLTERVIARTLGVSNGVVHGYVRRARLAGLTWPLPEDLDDESLELLLFPAPTAASQSDRRPSPDWAYVEKELRRRSVTRLLLWEEYRAANPDGFGYTWFCTTFEAWKQRTRPSMRQTHVGGEKVFVDFAGDTIDIFDPITGEVRAMKLFVEAMGASNYTYAERSE